MMYLPQRGSLSRRMSGYVVASTDNPTGWRPDYRRLGSDGVQDWKAAAAARDARARAQMWFAAAQQNAAMQQVARNDAWARGDRTPYRISGLGALGYTPLDPSSNMTPQAFYVFHFRQVGGITSPDPRVIDHILQGDANFSNTSTTAESGGYAIAFTYNGQGSILYQAAQEMQSVINNGLSNALFGNTANGTVSFLGAEGGPGGMVSAPGTPPPSSFDPTQFLAGLSTGGAIALGLGVLLLLKGI